MLSDDARSSDAASLRLPHARPAAAPRSGRLLRALSNPRLLAWNASLALASPALLALKARRRFRKHSDHEFDWERWRVSAPRLEMRGGPHVVLLAASYGEALLMERLTAELERSSPSMAVSWAIRDPNTRQSLQARLPGRRVVCWPFDSLLPVCRWLVRNDPDLLVFVERYNFPCLVAAAQAWGARCALVNGRAKGAFERASWVAPYYRWVLGGYEALCMQGDPAAQRVTPYARQGALHASANLKLDLPKPENAPPDLAKWIGQDPVLAAGSTDDAEEEQFVLDAYELVRARHRCRLLIAPRRIERAPELAAEAETRGWRSSRRTAPSEQADVLVLDTLGELPHAYASALGAFVGGTVTGQGHNVVEPLVWGVPVAYGPRRGHFEDLQRLCEREGVGVRCKTPSDLAEHWLRLLENDAHRQEIGTKAIQLVERERGGLERTAAVLEDLLKRGAA